MIKATILGMKNLPGFGPHPGTGALIGAFLLGGLAPYDQGILMMLQGSLIFGGAVGFLYLIGAHGRGSDYLYRQGKIKG